MEIKKTQTKAFANLIASLVLIAFEVWAWVQTTKIKTAKNAAVQPSTFPRIMIIGMAVFTVVLLIQSIIKLGSMKPNDPLAARAQSLNFIKDKGVLAALVVILLCCVYVYFFKSLGYVVVSFVLSAVIMWMIGMRKPKTGAASAHLGAGAARHVADLLQVPVGQYPDGRAPVP